MTKTYKLKGYIGNIISTISYTIIITVIVSSIFVFNNWVPVKAAGNNYYVDSVIGSDTNNGLSPTTALKSINQCVNYVAVSGDTCLLNPDVTYRYTGPGINRSNITIKSSNPNKKALVTSLVPITPNVNNFGSWQNQGSNIYKIQLPLNLSTFSGKNIAINRNTNQIKTDAKWPNSTSVIPRRADYKTSQNGTLGTNVSGSDYNSTYTTSDMPTWANGAEISYVSGYEWINQHSIVSNLSGNTITFRHQSQGSWNNPNVDDSFFLFNKLEALDAENEVFTNETTHELYIYSSSDPNTQNLEIKDLGAGYWNISGANTTLQGLHFESIDMTVQQGADNVIFDNVLDELGNHTYRYNDMNPAIHALGQNLTVTNSEFKDTSFFGLTVLGTGTITNNLFNASQFDHQGYLYPTGSRADISNNTVLHANGSGMQLAGIANGALINNNYVGDFGQLYSDIGGINRLSGDYNNDLGGMRVTRNFVANGKSKTGYAGLVNGKAGYYEGSKGVYFDSGYSNGGSYNFTVDHNVIVNNNSSDALSIWGLYSNNQGYLNENIKIYNNTADARLFLMSGDRRFANSEIKNNIVTTINSNNNSGNSNEVPSGITFTPNILTGISDNYVNQPLSNQQDVRLNSNNILTTKNTSNIDLAGYNANLLNGSPAINSGVSLGSITSNVTDGQPDMGAIEQGQEIPYYGALLRPSDLTQLSLNCTNQLNQTSCDVANLPLGRIVNPTFKLKTSNGIESTKCTTAYNHTTYYHTAKCIFSSYLPSTNLNVQASTDSTNYVNINGNLSTAPSPVITNITNQSGTTDYSLTGTNFTGDKQEYWQLDKNSLKSGANRLSLNTAQLISVGSMKSDCSDIHVAKIGQDIPVWIQDCNQTNSILHFSVNDLASSYVVIYGDLAKSYNVIQKELIYPTVFGADNLLWVDANNGVTNDVNDNVSSWQDSRNNGKQLIQDNSLYGGYNFKPKLDKSDGIGKYSLKFTSDFMQIGNLKNTSGATTQYLIAKDPTLSSSSEYWQRLISTRSTNAPNDTDHSNLIRKSGPNGEPLPYNKGIYKNSVTTSLENLYLGARVDNNFIWPSNVLTSNIYSMMIFGSDLSDSQDKEVADFMSYTNDLISANATISKIFKAVTININSSANCSLTTVSSSSANCSTTSVLTNNTATLSNNLGLVGTYTFSGQASLLDLKVNLEGAYDTNAGLMRTKLRQGNFIPFTQPYNIAPYNYTGTESVPANTMPSDMVDWVLVELRQGTAIVTQKAGILKADGKVIDTTTNSGIVFNNLPTGSYQVVVRHRNHLAIGTNTPIILTLGQVAILDLTTNANVKGFNQAVLKAGVYGMRRANTNGNNAISASDRALSRQAADSNNIYGQADINMDGMINSQDRAMSRLSTEVIETI